MVVLRLELWKLWSIWIFFLFWISLFRSFFLNDFVAVFIVFLWFLRNRFRLREYLIFDILWLLDVELWVSLKANNSFYLANGLLDGKEFVHESKFHLVIDIRKIFRVAKSFQDDKFLIGSLLSDSLVYQFLDQFFIIMDWTEF